MPIETNMRLSKMEVEICVKCKKEIPDDNEIRYLRIPLKSATNSGAFRPLVPE
jgi:hydrogenase maturation factor HypF (carbamoyltransferase family)